MKSDRLDKLIDLVGQSDKLKHLAPGITPQQVREIVVYGHIHFDPAYAGLPVSNEVAIVSCPDHSVHMVQITIDGPNSPKNHLCCVTCYSPKNQVHCAAAVAAFVVRLAEWEPPVKADVCQGCGEVLE